MFGVSELRAGAVVVRQFRHTTRMRRTVVSPVSEGAPLRFSLVAVIERWRLRVLFGGIVRYRFRPSVPVLGQVPL